MGDKSASTSPYGQIFKMSELPHASNLDPITTRMVRLEDILPSNKPSPPSVHDSSIHGTVAGTIVDNHTACWTPSENKMFEVALAQVDEHDPQRWEKIATWVPEKTVEQVKEHYLCLVEDIESIHSGRVPIPCYVDEDPDRKLLSEGKKNGKETAEKKKEKETAPPEKPSKKKTVKERRRGVPWTEEEHWWFLFGLSNYGKGDWRNIAKRFVPTRTTTQVASHAQKFFKRPFKLAKQNGEKRKGSIHDVRSINDSKAFSSPHANSAINPWPFLSPMHKHELLEQLRNAPGKSSAQGPLPAFLPKPQASLLNQTTTGLGSDSPNILGGNSMNYPSNCFGSWKFPADNLSGSSTNSALESLNSKPGNFLNNNSTSWLRNYQGNNLSNGFPGFHPNNLSFMSSNSPSSYFDGQPSSYSGLFSNSHNSNLDGQPRSYSGVFSNSHNSNLDGQPSNYSEVFSESHNSNLDGQPSNYSGVSSNSHNTNLDGQPSSYSGVFSTSHNSNLDGQFGWPANSLTSNLSIGFGDKMLNNVSSGAGNLSGGGFENFPSTNLSDEPGNSILPLNDMNGWAEKCPSNSLMGEFGYQLPSNLLGDTGNYQPSNLTGEFATSNEMEEFVNFPPYNSSF